MSDATPRPWRATIRQITGKATCFYGYVATGAKDTNRCCHRQHTSAAEAHLCAAREASRRNAHDRLQRMAEAGQELVDAFYPCMDKWSSENLNRWQAAADAYEEASRD